MSSKDDANLGSNEILVTGVIFGSIALVAVFLRFLTKDTNPTARPGWDDWSILVAAVLFCVEASLQIWATRIARSSHPDFSHMSKIAYISGQFYSGTACLIKVSVLLLYRRIFDTPSFRLASFIVMGFCICWAVGVGFAEVLVCNPPQKSWDANVKGHCYPYGKLQVSGLVSELVLDTIILSLPVRMVLGLQMSRARKLSVSLIFLLGGFVLVTNIVRLAMTYDPRTDGDIGWYDELWLNIHLGTAILCACLPVYGPLVQKATHLTTRLLVNYKLTSWSRRSSANTQPVLPKDPTGETKERSQYIKIDEYTVGKIQPEVQKPTRSPTEDNGAIELTDSIKSPEIV